MHHKILNRQWFLLSQLVVIFNSFLTEMGEIVHSTPERGGKVLFMTDFLIDWTEFVIKLLIGAVQIQNVMLE